MTQESQDLFGARSRCMRRIELAYVLEESGAMTVIVQAYPEGKRDPIRLVAHVGDSYSPAPVLGVVMPLIHRTYVGAETWRRSAEKVAKTLGADGYEVSLS